jgi:hypothetical protein
MKVSLPKLAIFGKPRQGPPMLYLYILRFILCFWYAPDYTHRAEEIRAIAHDIAATDAKPIEALTLANIASMESGFERSAVGKLGERGPFQQLGGVYDANHPAREALRRLRSQGLLGYMGCTRETEKCQQMAANRSVKAIVYSATFPFGSADEKIALAR